MKDPGTNFGICGGWLCSQRCRRKKPVHTSLGRLLRLWQDESGQDLLEYVLLIALIPWTDKWVPAAEYAGGATIDLCVMLVIVDSLHRFIEGPKPRKKSMPAKAES